MENLLKNKLNKNKGITLIALVITIVVIIIIAGVAISIALDNNSLFRRAQEGTDTYTEAQIREKLQMAIIEVQIDYYVQNESGTFRNFIFSTETGKGQEKLKAILGESNLIFDSANNKITYKSYEYEIAENAMITKVGEGGSSGGAEQGETVTYVTRADITPQPAGGIFTSGDEVNLGNEKFFVISDDGTTVTLLAKYCLNIYGTEQLLENEDWYGSNYAYGYGKYFSNTTYWASDFTTSPFDLQTETMIAKARTDGNVELNASQNEWYSVGGEGVPNVMNTLYNYGLLKRVRTYRLMTYDEAYTILSGSNSRLKEILTGTWNDGTQPTEDGLIWWLGDAYDSEGIWSIYGGNAYWAEDKTDCLYEAGYTSPHYGVRPIFEIQ